MPTSRPGKQLLSVITELSVLNGEPIIDGARHAFHDIADDGLVRQERKDSPELLTRV